MMSLKRYITWPYLIVIHFLAILTIIHFIRFSSNPIYIPQLQLSEMTIESTPIDSTMTLADLSLALIKAFDTVFYSLLNEGQDFRPARRAVVYFRLDAGLITVFLDGNYQPCSSCEIFTLIRANVVQDSISGEFLFDGESFVSRGDMTVSKYLIFDTAKGGDNVIEAGLLHPIRRDGLVTSATEE